MKLHRGMKEHGSDVGTLSQHRLQKGESQGGFKKMQHLEMI